VRGVSDVDAARIIRADGIDLLIERKGHTRGGRLGILAARPASVQLHYMSFPGTLGYDAVDGIIADDVVIPDTDEAFYHERIWRMPRCYFVNDGRRALPAAATRDAAGLPDDALVLACLNQSYKLTPPVFSIWMDVMARTPGAVLWLLAAGMRAEANLRAYAARAGVDPARLVFAPQVPQEPHIARLRCADLALDTLPYGSHTTGCDALWAGVPMLTCPGRTFASRVGASLLRTAGLPELVAASLGDYRARLADLASSPATLRDYRRFLERTRYDNPLFDTAGFARDWERLLERAYEGTLAAR
jgi:protein O-GlcNAc transferase